MASAADEPDAMYGFAARAVRISPDGLVYRFALRPQARFHDGTKLTAQDAAFSLQPAQGQGPPDHPAARCATMAGVEAADDETLVVRFVEKRARDMPLFVASLPIFSRAYYTAHNFDETTLDMPLGSGPYKVGRFEAGRYIEYQRVADWWGAELPVNVGQNNFDIAALRILPGPRRRLRGLHREELSLPRGVHLAHLGDALRFPGAARRPGEARRTARRYAVGRAGLVHQPAARRNSPIRSCALALNYAFDFEWTNKTIMYGSYLRTQSVFQNSDMMAKGPPSPEELELLEPWRGRVPDQVFGEPFVPPVSDGSGQDRAMLRKASQMLQRCRLPDQGRQAGQCQGRADHLRVPDRRADASSRTTCRSSRTSGRSASRRTLRIVDPVQYRARVDDFDFDVTIERIGFSTIAGRFAAQLLLLAGGRDQGLAEPRRHRRSGGRRPDREDHRRQDARGAGDRCRALDRVLRAGYYWIPHWYKPSHWIAYWDVFGRPGRSRVMLAAFRETWWYDATRPRKRREIRDNQLRGVQ